jgi:hypothetical protein
MSTKTGSIGRKGAEVSGECKEGLAASFGLVFLPSEGLLNKWNNKQDV